MTLEYEPNEFISEKFVRNSAACSACKRDYFPPQKLKLEPDSNSYRATHPDP